MKNKNEKQEIKNRKQKSKGNEVQYYVEIIRMKKSLHRNYKYQVDGEEEISEN